MKSLITLVCCMPFLAQADQGWIGISSDFQDYSKGFRAAHTQSLTGAWQQETRTLYGEISDYRRGNRRDLPVQLGLYQQVTESGQLHLEGSLTADPQLKPEWQQYAGWYQALPGGWTLEPGYQWTRYPSVAVEKASIVVEKYWQTFRFAYGGARVSLKGEHAFNHRVQADWLYREGDKLSVGLATGDDQEVLDTGVVIQTPVRSGFVAGEHALSAQWQALWQLQQVNQGDVYRQQGGRIGLRYRF